MRLIYWTVGETGNPEAAMQGGGEGAPKDEVLRIGYAKFKDAFVVGLRAYATVSPK